MFSFVLLDESVTPTRIIAARDPIGITTLYQGWSSARPGAVYFASELKALIDECDTIISFPPGHVYDSADDSTVRYFNPTWWEGDAEGEKATIPDAHADLTTLREALEAAVRKRLMSEVPYGVLLSGGLDSSLIAAIAARETEKVALAQAEKRRKKLLEIQSGPSSPIPGAIADEYGTYLLFTVSQIFNELVRSNNRVLAATALLLHRPRELPRPARRAQGRTLPRNRAPRVRLHRPGGTRRDPRRDSPPRDLRRNDGAGEHADVPPLAQDQGHGREDGAQRRGVRRGVRRVLVLP